MKVQLYAYLTGFDLNYIDMKDLANPEKMIQHTHYATYDPAKHGHVVVGTAEIDVELLPPDQIVGNAVLALRCKASEIRAKASAEAADLEGKAQQLLAIENKVPA